MIKRHRTLKTYMTNDSKTSGFEKGSFICLALLVVFAAIVAFSSVQHSNHIDVGDERLANRTEHLLDRVEALEAKAGIPKP